MCSPERQALYLRIKDDRIKELEADLQSKDVRIKELEADLQSKQATLRGKERRAILVSIQVTATRVEFDRFISELTRARTQILMSV